MFADPQQAYCDFMFKNFSPVIAKFSKKYLTKLFFWYIITDDSRVCGTLSGRPFDFESGGICLLSACGLLLPLLLLRVQ
jgi:hypothetical protein